MTLLKMFIYHDTLEQMVIYIYIGGEMKKVMRQIITKLLHFFTDEGMYRSKIS